MKEYKDTLNLPETTFPMKANLTQSEPKTLENWKGKNAYTAMISANDANEHFILHDGPPYANGNIHLGTALNKILKDFIVKSRNMQGQKTEYVPGWDCHGLPVEHKVAHKLGEKAKTLPTHVVRKECRAWAEKYLNIQREEFKRLGVLGVWDEPYVTMKPSYEAVTAKELANFMENGSLLRHKKPIYWCADCVTALAEAEVEYHDHTSDSIFVRFPLADAGLKKLFPEAELARAYALIWTTTPWTIPSNMAIMAHPEFDYVLVRAGGDYYLLAEGLLENCKEMFGWSGLADFSALGAVKGAQLENLKARHPIYERESKILLSECVTLEAGTGLVHCAPGHGPDDYETGQRYGIETYSPVDDQGRFLDVVEYFAGMNVFEANPKVIEKLKEVGNLVHSGRITHSYPHCWRCKKPVIFRATTQWFISMAKNDLRKRALQAIDKEVRWIPAWGRDRIYNMVEMRPDWCISRQRLWGVPILALICKNCDAAWYDPDWARGVADKFAAHPTGCDYWFENEVDTLAPADLCCPSCGKKDWRKETDILDVWFDSGTSFAAVLEQRKECGFPADLYLEGSDQHRGWFHSSLLVSIGNRGCAPYKSVLTHGYVVDKDGKKMSKSLGNVIAPQAVIEKHGAEILRLWVSAVDYREDIRISDEILSRLIDAYRRLRNTCRYILGNISDLTPETMVAPEDMDGLDRFAWHLASETHAKVLEAYREYEFHKVYHCLHNLCATELSAFYLDILKDRLYASAPDSAKRRSAQTAMYHILMMLMADMAPILSFMAEEVFQHMPETLRPKADTVFALRMDKMQTLTLSETELAVWEDLLLVRGVVTKAIEPLRKSGEIGHSLDTHVTVYAGPELLKRLQGLNTDLRAAFIVSAITLAPLSDAPQEAARFEDSADVAVGVAKAKGEKCARCWIYDQNLGSDSAYPEACPRCTAVLKSL